MKQYTVDYCDKIAEIRSLLSEQLQHEELVDSWFTYPNMAFGGLTPDLLINRGEIDRVLKFLRTCTHKSRQNKIN